MQWIHSELSPCDRRNTQAWSWPATETCVLFPAAVNSVFSTACSVVLFPGPTKNTTFRHRWWTYQTSLHCVKDKKKMWSRRSFWSCVKIRGTIFAEISLIPKSSFTICRTSPYSYSILLLLLSYLILDLSAPRFVLCPHLHLSFTFFAAHFLGSLAYFLALPWTGCAIQKHSISS